VYRPFNKKIFYKDLYKNTTSSDCIPLRVYNQKPSLESLWLSPTPWFKLYFCCLSWVVW